MVSRPYRPSALPMTRLVVLGLVLVIALASAVPAHAGSLPRSSPIHSDLSSQASPRLAASIWPMAHHDAQHTGRSSYRGPQTNAVDWSVDTGFGLLDAVVDDTGTIYAESTSMYGVGVLEAISRAGSILWSYQFSATPWSGDVTPAVGPNGTIYVGTYEFTNPPQGSLVAVNPDGSIQWTYPAGEAFSASPIVDADGTIYIGSLANTGAEGHLFAVYPDGTLKWKTPFNWRITSTPALGHDGTIYVKTLWSLHAVNSDGTIKWTSPNLQVGHDQDNYFGPSVADDGTIYVTGNNKLYALRPTDGSILWTFTTGAYNWGIPAIGPGGAVYLSSTDGKLYAVDPSNGSELWSFATDNSDFRSAVVDGIGTIYVSGASDLIALRPDGTELWRRAGVTCRTPTIGDDGSLFCIHAGTLYKFRSTQPSVWPTFRHDAQRSGRSPFAGPQASDIAWTFTTGGAVNSSPAVDGEGTIYVGSADGKFYAVNPDGTEAWSYTTGGPIVASPALSPDGSIYFGSYDGKLYALQPDGTFGWTYQTGAAIESSPVIGLDGTIYTGSNDGQMYAVYPDSTLRCTYAGGWGTPSIGPDETVYVATTDRRVAALTPNCVLKCQTPQVGNAISSTPALSTDGSTMYVGAQDGFLRAYHTSDCSEKWQSPYTYGGVTASAAIGSDDTVYVGTEYGYLWALDPADGSLRWQVYTTLTARASPAIAGDGAIYFPTAYGYVFARNPDSSQRWTYTNDNGAAGHFFSSPAITADGLLVVGSENGKLYAFGPSPQLHLAKSASRATAQPGDLVSYTLILTTTATSAAHAVLTDTLPSGMTYVPGSVTGGATYSSGQILFDGIVTPGPGVTLGYQTTVDTGLQPGSVLYNSAVVTGTGYLLQRGVPVAIPNDTFSGTLVLIYANGDNNLSDQMLRLINQAEAAAANPAVKVLLLLDGPGANDSYLYYLQPDATNLACPNYINPTCNGRYVWDQTIFRWGEDVATPYSLAEFIVGAVTAYPLASQVVLSLVGHGGGWSPEALASQPSAYDEQPGSDPLGGMLWDAHPGHSLSTPELGDALAWARLATGRGIDLLYLDACLMAMTEVAYEVRHDAAYLLASENSSWTAFPYGQHIGDIQPAMDAADIGLAWLQNEANALRPDGYPFTLSLADLQQMNALRSSTDGLANVLLGAFPAGKSGVQAAFASTVVDGCFDSNVDGAIDAQDNHCDLLLLAERIEQQFAGNGPVVAAAQGVQTAVANAVFAEDHQGGVPWTHPTQTWSWGALGGLSIYAPLGADNWKRHFYTGQHLQVAADGAWDELLAAYWEGAVPPTVPLCPPNCDVPPGPPALQADKIQVSNVQDASFTVSWQTAGPTQGELRYGTDPNALNQSAFDLRGADTFDDVHYVVVQQLNPNTHYYFDLLYDGQVDDNGGAHYAVTTGPTLPAPPPPDQVYGLVLAPDGVTPAENVLVMITLQDGDGAGSPGDAALLSDIVESADAGYWNVNLGNARTADLQSAFQYSAQGDRLRLLATDGSGCAAEQVVDTASDTPASAMTLACDTLATHQLATGWNLVGLNVTSDPMPLAEDALDDIAAQGGNSTEIDQWLNGGWEAHIHNLPFNDFPLALGKGYFVKSLGASTWQRIGRPPSNPLPVALTPGWNLIGLPKLAGALTAEQMLDGIESQGGACLEIDRWQYGGWNGHIHNMPFNNFTLRTDEGYFVKCSQASTYIPPLAEHRSADFALAPAEMAALALAANPAIGDVLVTNRRDVALTVVWRTDQPSDGWVAYGPTPALGQVAYDDRGAKAVSAVHHVTLTGLAPGAPVYYRIHSGKMTLDREGKPLEAATLAASVPGAPLTVYGQVLHADGIPAVGAVVVARLVADAGSKPGPLSAPVDGWGYWVLSLPEIDCQQFELHLEVVDPSGATVETRRSACQ